MPARAISMRTIREVLRLALTTSLSERQIARSVGVARSTVATYVKRAHELGWTWPLPGMLGEQDVRALLRGESTPVVTLPVRTLPNWADVHKELQRKGVTLQLLWKEYREQYADGYGYSRYCELYRSWTGTIDVVMRQHHAPGERLFVDYAGMTMPVVDPETGDIRQVQIFVATLGCSNLLYVEATETQQVHDWIASHVRALRFIGGVPQLIINDNLRSGVKRPCRYDPDINRSYEEFAAYYGVAILPARVRKPRDKAKVETGVQITEREILAPLRNRTFFSLHALNEAIAELLDVVNNRPFQKLPGNRRSRFEELDKPALQPLPRMPYVCAEWSKARVNIDYHIAHDGHYYSVPYKYARTEVDVRTTALTVECYIDMRRIASHRRSRHKGAHTTVDEHMPSSHRRYAEWTPERILQWARTIGPETALLAERIMEHRAHPEQGFRTCLGLIRLHKSYSVERMEAAASVALQIGAVRLRSIRSILETGRDRRASPVVNEEDSTIVHHSNIRGPALFAQRDVSSTISGDRNHADTSNH